jgi:integrase
MEALRAHRARQLAERLAVADVWADRGLVFCDELGDFLNGVSIERCAYQRALTRAGLPHKRFHDLRHTAATLLLEQGVPIKMVSAMLGHTSIAIAADIYSHVTPALECAAASTMDGLFRKSAG